MGRNKRLPRIAPHVYGYVNQDPVNFVDPSGLASAGVPLNPNNCAALQKIIDYEKKNGKFQTILTYNPFNFSSDAVDLDAAFESTGGPVSIDWMMRNAGFGITTLPGLPMFTYSFGKQLRNTMALNNPWLNIENEANLNSASALSYWYYGESGSITLESMFSPAVKQCKCMSK